MSHATAGDLAVSACAEFLGTAVLVFTIGCNVLSSNGIWGVYATQLPHRASKVVNRTFSGTYTPTACSKMRKGRKIICQYY
eukprot:6478803-Amphidinium_carterae.1